MKAKQYIYHWLFFPLLVLLLASGVASCSNDPAMEEEDTSGKTTLSVTVRGVSKNSASDEYIKTLRIIVFDASGMVCNQFYSENDIENWVINGSGTDTYYEIIQKLANFSGGSSRFYFIANEEGYTISDGNTELSAFLDDENLTEDALKACIMAFIDIQDWSAKPILMIANPSARYIKPGDNIKIADVKLIRCVAKVQLIVQKDNMDKYRIPENDVVTISDVSLHGTRPDSYSLWDTKSHFATNRKYTHNFTIANVNVGYGTGGSPAYTSDMVYFPETLSQNNTTEGVLYFTFTLNYTPNGANTPTVRTYTVAIGDDADDDGIVEDYNIYRNTIYTVTATLQWQPTEPEMNIQVDAWGKKTMDVPAFK